MSIVTEQLGMHVQWTEEKINTLKELWSADQLSAREIGIVIQMTRNAVIGKARRLGLMSKAISTPKRQSDAQTREMLRQAARDARPLRIAPQPLPKPPIVSVEGGLSILELEPDHCRAIIGHGDDGMARYCGATRRHMVDALGHPTGSWCPGHAAIYIRPMEPRRR